MENFSLCPDWIPPFLLFAGPGIALIIYGIGYFVGSGGLPWNELGRAKRRREKELRARMALYIQAGLSEYAASDRASDDLRREANDVLKELH